MYTYIYVCMCVHSFFKKSVVAQYFYEAMPRMASASPGGAYIEPLTPRQVLKPRYLPPDKDVQKRIKIAREAYVETAQTKAKFQGSIVCISPLPNAHGYEDPFRSDHRGLLSRSLIQILRDQIPKGKVLTGTGVAFALKKWCFKNGLVDTFCLSTSSNKAARHCWYLFED